MPQAVPLPVWGYVLLLAPSVVALLMIFKMSVSMMAPPAVNVPMPRPPGCHPRHEMPMPPAGIADAAPAHPVDLAAQAFARQHQVRHFYMVDGDIIVVRWRGERPFNMDGYLDQFPAYNEEPF